MTKEYLGEEVLTSLKNTPFEYYGIPDWALFFIRYYGQIDGDHHKAWVLDQVARILHGTHVEVRLARWSDGTSEYRVSTGEPSLNYEEFVEDMRYDSEDDEEYEYDTGIAP